MTIHCENRPIKSVFRPRDRSSVRQGLHRVVIRSIDVCFALIAIVFLFPLLFLISSIVFFENRGNVIFTQERYGVFRRKFQIYKFRTMTVSEKGSKFTQATSDDPRVTLFGRFLRRSSLDELPQLFNILKGDMSIVGPRPHPTALDEELEQYCSDYNRRFDVLPGVTGLAQVRGYRGPTDTNDKILGRIYSDIEFVDRYSIALYFSIILKTFPAVLSRKNAY